MFTYILRRILSSIPVLIGILFATFALARLLPGDPCRAVLGEKATDAICNEFLHRHGLDKPIPVQFVVYVNEIAHGDFGVSFRYSESVSQLLVERLPTTIELTFCALILSLVIGIPLGIISAVRHNSWVDVLTMTWANIGVSMPVFWLGLMLAFVFSLLLKGTPIALPSFWSPDGRRPCALLCTGLGVESPGSELLGCRSRIHQPHEYSQRRFDSQLVAARRCD